MKRIKAWFLDRFLPMWAKETVLADNRRLQLQVAELREQLDQKEAYIAGMIAGMKSQRRIVINTAEEKK
jgi:hypothetical protein